MDFSDYRSDVVEVLKCRVSIVSKMFTSFSFSKCDTKTRINKGYTSRKTH